MVRGCLWAPGFGNRTFPNSALCEKIMWANLGSQARTVRQLVRLYLVFNGSWSQQRPPHAHSANYTAMVLSKPNHIEQTEDQFERTLESSQNDPPTKQTIVERSHKSSLLSVLSTKVNTESNNQLSPELRWFVAPPKVEWTDSTSCLPPSLWGLNWRWSTTRRDFIQRSFWRMSILLPTFLLRRAYLAS